MATVRYSRRAEADLLSIGEYTLETWGETQADRYLGELEACCDRLALRPATGRLSGRLRPDLRRMETEKHVVFYREVSDGILVSRILHQSMLPERHFLDEEDGEGG